MAAAATASPPAAGRRDSEPIASSSPLTGTKPLTEAAASANGVMPTPTPGQLAAAAINGMSDHKDGAMNGRSASVGALPNGAATAATPAGVKPVKPKHRKINKKHPEFELTYDMMLGIRTCVGGISNKPAPKLTPAHAQTTTKLDFPGQGSPTTPAHQMRNFSFKDYAPDIFRAIRDMSALDPLEYLLCVCGNFKFLEFISNSKSGQFFFYSHDRKYMIKTISDDESVFLRTIMWDYYEHLRAYPNTLLNRFYGMHRVKPYKKPQMHFLIMGSVFYTDKFIFKTFDLKGSTQGRAATDKEKQRTFCVYKDLDYLEMKTALHLGPQRDAFLKQLAIDADFLRRHNIMDYSLLVGIHHPENNGPDSQPGSPASPDAVRPALSAASAGAVTALRFDGAGVTDMKSGHTTSDTSFRPLELHPEGRDHAASRSGMAGGGGRPSTADEASDDEEYRDWRRKNAAALATTTVNGVPQHMTPSRTFNAPSVGRASPHPLTLAAAADSDADADGLDFDNDHIDAANRPAHGYDTIQLANAKSPLAATAAVTTAAAPNQSQSTTTGAATTNTSLSTTLTTNLDAKSNPSATVEAIPALVKPRASSLAATATGATATSNTRLLTPTKPGTGGAAGSATGILSPDVRSRLNELRVATGGAPEVEVVDASEFDKVPARASRLHKPQAYYGVPKNHSVKTPSQYNFAAPDLFEQVMNASLKVALSAASGQFGVAGAVVADATAHPFQPTAAGTAAAPATANGDAAAATAAALKRQVSSGSDTDADTGADSKYPKPATAAAAKPAIRGVSAFTRDSGGVAGGGEIYFLGIIDILTEYTTKKKIESAAKSLKYDSKTISAVAPAVYAARFLKFIENGVR